MHERLWKGSQLRWKIMVCIEKSDAWHSLSYKLCIGRTKERDNNNKKKIQVQSNSDNYI